MQRRGGRPRKLRHVPRARAQRRARPSEPGRRRSPAAWRAAVPRVRRREVGPLHLVLEVRGGRDDGGTWRARHRHRRSAPPPTMAVSPRAGEHASGDGTLAEKARGACSSRTALPPRRARPRANSSVPGIASAAPNAGRRRRQTALLHGALSDNCDFGAAERAANRRRRSALGEARAAPAQTPCRLLVDAFGEHLEQSVEPHDGELALRRQPMLGTPILRLALQHTRIGGCRARHDALGDGDARRRARHHLYGGGGGRARRSRTTTSETRTTKARANRREVRRHRARHAERVNARKHGYGGVRRNFVPAGAAAARRGARATRRRGGERTRAAGEAPFAAAEAGSRVLAPASGGERTDDVRSSRARAGARAQNCPSRRDRRGVDVPRLAHAVRRRSQAHRRVCYEGHRRGIRRRGGVRRRRLITGAGTRPSSGGERA